MGVAGRNNRKIGSGYSDANTTHSTLGDKNFVQNYFKVSSGQNRALSPVFPN